MQPHEPKNDYLITEIRGTPELDAEIFKLSIYTATTKTQ